VLQSAFFDIKREAAKKTAFRDDSRPLIPAAAQSLIGPDYPNLR